MIITTNAIDRGPSLLAAIIAEPEADDLRLIYADWLEDSGEDERADLIRWMVAQKNANATFRPSFNYLICESSHPLVGSPYNYGNWACSMRKAMVGTAEIADVPPFGIAEEFEVIFRRGFIAEVHAPLAVLVKHLPALVQQHPIEEARATDKEPEFFENLSNPWTWWGSSCGDLTARLPEAIWYCMEGFWDSTTENAKDYPTAEAAHNALSRALLKGARG